MTRSAGFLLVAQLAAGGVEAAGDPARSTVRIAITRPVDRPALPAWLLLHEAIQSHRVAFEVTDDRPEATVEPLASSYAVLEQAPYRQCTVVVELQILGSKERIEGQGYGCSTAARKVLDQVASAVFQARAGVMQARCWSARECLCPASRHAS